MSPDDAPDLAAGTLFAGFRILGVLGSGGMGTVYRALDLTLDHERALKVLTADLTDDRSFRERFQRESRLAAQLEDEGVVPIYGAGEAEGRLYIAMRLVRGSDLHRLVQAEGPLTLARTAKVTAAVASALDAAHARGIVHRDVKPANILVEASGGDERVFLTDFGISRPAGATTSITSTGQLLGTPDYISPEQIDGAPAGAPADVYALGCVVSFLLTGEAPFHRENAVATLYAHAHAERPRPSLLAPELPDGVDEVLARATAVDPEARFASAGQLAAALMDKVDPHERPAGATAAPITPRTRELPRAQRPRRGWLAIAATTAVLVAAGTAALLAGGDEDSSPSAPPSTAVSEIEVGDAVDSVVVGGVNVLVGSQDGSVLHTIDPETLDLGATPRVVQHPTAVAVGFGSVWVTSRSADQLLRYGPEDPEIAEPIAVGDEPVDVAVGEEWVWVANRTDGTVTQIDPLDNSVEATIDVAREPHSVVADDEANVTWVASPSAGLLTKIDSGAPQASGVPVQLGGAPTDLAIVDGSLWKVDASNGTLAELSLDEGRRRKEIELGGEPVALAVGPGALWVADKARDRAIRVDPATGQQEQVDVGNRPVAVAVGAGAVWVTNAGDETVTRIER